MWESDPCALSGQGTSKNAKKRRGRSRYLHTKTKMPLKLPGIYSLRYAATRRRCDAQSVEAISNTFIRHFEGGVVSSNMVKFDQVHSRGWLLVKSGINEKGIS